MELVSANAKQRLRLLWQSTELLIENKGQYHSEVGIDDEDSAAVNVYWNAKGWDHQWTGADDKKWEIIELCSLNDLIHEGATLQHCVATYAGKCVAGTSRIFSLRRDGHPQVTVEVDTRLKQIRQARGKQNRAASQEELERIQQWISSIQIEAN